GLQPAACRCSVGHAEEVTNPRTTYTSGPQLQLHTSPLSALSTLLEPNQHPHLPQRPCRAKSKFTHPLFTFFFHVQGAHFRCFLPLSRQTALEVVYTDGKMLPLPARTDQRVGSWDDSRSRLG